MQKEHLDILYPILKKSIEKQGYRILKIWDTVELDEKWEQFNFIIKDRTWKHYNIRVWADAIKPQTAKYIYENGYYIPIESEVV